MSAVVAVSDGENAEFQMRIGNAPSDQLSLIGALEVAKRRMVRLVDYEDSEQE